MYLKQKGLKISGSKAELIDRVLTHARGNLSPDDCSNDSSTYVEGSFEVMFVPEEEIQKVN